MNNVSLMGRTTKEITLKTSAAGNFYCNFTLAVNRTMKDKKTQKYEADFINCSAFGKTAELLSTVYKGSMIGIEGKINTSSKMDEETGKIQYFTNVSVSSLTFANSKGEQLAEDLTTEEETANVFLSEEELPF